MTATLRKPESVVPDKSAVLTQKEQVEKSEKRAVASQTGLGGAAQLGVCVVGVQASFLVWGMCQERLSTTLYPSTAPHSLPGGDRFRHPLFLNLVQNVFCALAALLLVALTKPPAASWPAALGYPAASPATPRPSAARRSPLVLLKSLTTIAVGASLAQPFGFLAASHLSFPAVLLGKSVKLVPVLLVNVVLYRRRFAPYKYALVALVTLGVWCFLAFGPSKAPAGAGGRASSLVGVGLLALDLSLDGVVNSTQDFVFATFALSGPQMMLLMNAMSALVNLLALLVPSSLTPAFLLPASATATSASAAPNALSAALAYLAAHPSALSDLLTYAACGAVGQLFIFLTLSLYGSLTLVSITVTRKMASMLLSIALFRHQVARGQWVGIGLVFAGIGMDAWGTRRDKLAKVRAVEGKKDK